MERNRTAILSIEISQRHIVPSSLYSVTSFDKKSAASRMVFSGWIAVPGWILHSNHQGPMLVPPKTHRRIRSTRIGSVHAMPSGSDRTSTSIDPKHIEYQAIPDGSPRLRRNERKDACFDFVSRTERHAWILPSRKQSFGRPKKRRST